MELAGKDSKAALRRLHDILSPVTIRSTNGNFKLPPLRYKEVMLKPSETQKAFCDALRMFCVRARAAPDGRREPRHPRRRRHGGSRG
jgi:hypothetical protein